MDANILKQKAIVLRQQGLSYSEIQISLDFVIPKSTLSGWLRMVPLSEDIRKAHQLKNRIHLEKVRHIAVSVNKQKRDEYLRSIKDRNLYLLTLLNDPVKAKIALAMLYLGEGSKGNNRMVVFGNSDPNVVRLFLRLLRFCYKIDDRKIRCTVQCRWDQNQSELITYWMSISNIPQTKFYKTQVDPRTKGKPTLRKDYKGVCLITYLSTDVFLDIMLSIEILMGS